MSRLRLVHTFTDTCGGSQAEREVRGGPQPSPRSPPAHLALASGWGWGKDLITLARYVAGWQNADAYVPALDINGDKAINLTDVTTLARYLAGWNETISQEPYLGE